MCITLTGVLLTVPLFIYSLSIYLLSGLEPKYLKNNHCRYEKIVFKRNDFPVRSVYFCFLCTNTYHDCCLANCFTILDYSPIILKTIISNIVFESMTFQNKVCLPVCVYWTHHYFPKFVFSELTQISKKNGPYSPIAYQILLMNYFQKDLSCVKYTRCFANCFSISLLSLSVFIYRVKCVWI